MRTRLLPFLFPQDKEWEEKEEDPSFSLSIRKEEEEVPFPPLSLRKEDEDEEAHSLPFPAE